MYCSARVAWVPVLVWLAVAGLHQPAASQETWNCLWIAVTVGATPERIGWQLVSSTASNPGLIRGGGVRVGGYTKQMVAANGNSPQFCHLVRVSSTLGVRGFVLQLLSSDNKPWNDRSTIVSITDANCQEIVFKGIVPMEAYKDSSEPVTIKYLPPLPLTPNCAAPLISVAATRTIAPGIVTNAAKVTCPDPPVLSTARNLGPDLVPVMTEYFQKLEVKRECWSTSKVIKWNPKDPWNEKWQAYCEAIESKIPEGCHLVMRFRAGIANIGTTDMYLGSPYDQFLAGNPMWQWADCHRHWHWRGFASYELIDAVTGQVYKAKKTGYCAEDTRDMPNTLSLGVYNGVQSAVTWAGKKNRFTKCGTANKTACQGISVGKMDTYEADLSGQFFCLAGCREGAIPFNREYLVRITANPPFPNTPGVHCPFLDSKGMCHTVFELNYYNNVAQFKIKLTRDMVPSKFRNMIPAAPAVVPSRNLRPPPSPVPKPVLTPLPLPNPISPPSPLPNPVLPPPPLPNPDSPPPAVPDPVFPPSPVPDPVLPPSPVTDAVLPPSPPQPDPSITPLLLSGR